MKVSKRIKNFFKDPFNWFLLLLIGLNVLPILAPLFLKLGETLPFFNTPAKLIYFVYSFTCHQFDHRSLHLFDYQSAWCIRDTGIWLSVLVTSLLVKFKYIRKMPWYWILPFTIPILLDGGIQTIATMFGLAGSSVDTPIYISTNLVRFITGSIFGMGLGSVFSPWMMDDKDQNRTLGTAPQFFRLMIVFFSLFVCYLGAVQIWDLTSNKHGPVGLADNIVKTPDNGFFTRRAHGLCPAGVDDLMNLECFFK